MTALVIGVGNEFRRDDGIGPAVAAEVERLGVAGVRVLTTTGDAAEMIDAWDGVELTVLVDAVLGEDAVPGRIRRWRPGDDRFSAAVSSHTFDLPAACALGEALGRVPLAMVVLTVDVADVGHGTGLSPAVTAAVPAVTAAVLAEVEGLDAGAGG